MKNVNVKSLNLFQGTISSATRIANLLLAFHVVLQKLLQSALTFHKVAVTTTTAIFRMWVRMFLLSRIVNSFRYRNVTTCRCSNNNNSTWHMKWQIKKLRLAKCRKLAITPHMYATLQFTSCNCSCHTSVTSSEIFHTMGTPYSYRGEASYFIYAYIFDTARCQGKI